AVTKRAIAFYLASITTPILESSTEQCHFSGIATGTAPINATDSCAWFNNAAGGTTRMTTTTLHSNVRTVDGLGWVNINLNAITAGGSPLAQLPVDPLNSGDNYYT